MCSQCESYLCTFKWWEYPTPGETSPGIEVLCSTVLAAGHTCDTAWSDTCEADNPSGAEYNDAPLRESGCSQCADSAVAAAASAAIASAAVSAFHSSCPITREYCESFEDLPDNCNCGDCGFPACGDCDCDFYGDGHCCTGHTPPPPPPLPYVVASPPPPPLPYVG